MILHTNTNRYYGKTIARIEDEYGKELENLTLCESLVIIFTDGDRIILMQDWRGNECYFSQRDK